MDWMIILMYVVPSVCTIFTGGTIIFSRRKRRIEAERSKAELERVKAEADQAKESAKSVGITNDVNVIDLYKKVYGDLSVALTKDHEKLTTKIEQLSKDISRLEKALKSISRCKHARNCPVTKELEKMKKDEK